MGNCFDDEKPRKEIVAQKIPEDSKNKKGSSNKNDNNKKKQDTTQANKNNNNDKGKEVKANEKNYLKCIKKLKFFYISIIKK